MAGYFVGGIMKKILMLISITIFLVACQSKQVEKSVVLEGAGLEGGKLEVDPIEEKIKSMTLDEKLGQLIIAGFQANEYNEELDYLIKDLKLGGLIFFNRNIKSGLETQNLIKAIVENQDIRLFLSIDEEGGLVSRLPPDMVKMPKASEIGHINNEDLSYEIGKTIGINLRGLGFNMDFAPVLDINSNPKNPVIGTRAFGRDPDRVIAMAIPYMKAIQDEGVLAVGKHFPGHGDTDVDSHLDLPIIKKDKEEIEKLELRPFKEAIDNNIDGIMISHLMYEDLDPDYPSSISQIIIGDLLRGQLAYKGLIVSDDMTMNGIIKNYTIEEASFRFIKAGGDLALICHGQEEVRRVLEYFKLQVDQGRLLEGEIDEKLYRILEYKETLTYQPEDINYINDFSNKTIKDFKER